MVAPKTSSRDADAAVAKTAAIKNIQKALTARILKTLPDDSSADPETELVNDLVALEEVDAMVAEAEAAAAAEGSCNVSYVINFNNGCSGSATSSRFATGMNGDEDLGQDITMKGQKFHYRDAQSEPVWNPNSLENVGDDHSTMTANTRLPYQSTRGGAPVQYNPVPWNWYVDMPGKMEKWKY